MKSERQAHPQLTTEELQQLKWLLGGVLTLVSVATVFYLDVAAWTLVALTVAAVGVGWVRPAWPARVPRWVHRLAFSFVAAFFAGDLWLSGELLPATVRLDILLLLYRTIIYRRKREDLQLIVLGLFLVVVAGVLSVSLTFAVHILVFTGCALAFLLVITLASGDGERAKDKTPPPGEAGEVPGWARHVAWRRLLARVRAVTDWRVVALGGALFAGLVALSAGLFVAMPRFQLENSFFLERFISKKARSGFSDTIRFGDVTEITLDDGVALSVDVSDRGAIPPAPYWRMMVLDEYRDGTFRLSSALRTAAFGRERSGVRLQGEASGRSGGGAAWTFYLEPGVSRYLPLAGRFGTLAFWERQNFRFARAPGVVALREEPVRMTAYRVENMDTGALRVDRAFARQLAGGAGARALMLRTGVNEADRAVLARVLREIAGGAEGLGTEEFLRRAEAWLRVRHGYSLRPRIPDGAGDPLVRWLASREAGHCELFAGSLVLLARAAGWPARVVTGFRGGSWNGYSNSFTVRNSEAHAWCEVFDRAREAWVRSDPTPGAVAGGPAGAAGEAVTARRVDRSWTARIESLRVFWYRRIVSFDEQSQRQTIEAAKAATEALGRRLREAVERVLGGVKAWVTQPWGGRRWAGMAAVLVVLAVVGWAGRNLRFEIWNLRNRRGEAVRGEAGRWLVRLRTRGLAREGEGTEVERELERLRFGARETWTEPAQVFRRARRIWREG